MKGEKQIEQTAKHLRLFEIEWKGSGWRSVAMPALLISMIKTFSLSDPELEE